MRLSDTLFEEPKKFEREDSNAYHEFRPSTRKQRIQAAFAALFIALFLAYFVTGSTPDATPEKIEVSR